LPSFRRRHPALLRTSRASRLCGSTRGGDQVEEQLIDGRRVVRVTTPLGQEYYLIEDLGDGAGLRNESLDHGVRVPLWVIRRSDAGAAVGDCFGHYVCFPRVTAEETSGLVKRLRHRRAGRSAGLAAGIEKKNYFVTTLHGRFVLTLSRGSASGASLLSETSWRTLRVTAYRAPRRSAGPQRQYSEP